MFGKDFTLSLRGYKIVSICLLALMLLAGVAAGQKKSRPTLWYYPAGGYENGKISELKDRHKVYISLFTGGFFPYGPQRISYQQRILNLLSSYKGLEVVKNPEEAELAVHISSFENGESVYEFYVLTRGEPQKNGGYKPRVVVKRLRSDSKDSTVLIEQAVSAFVDDLKAVRGEK